MKKFFTISCMAAMHSILCSQVVLTTLGSTETIDFTGFAGSGFTPVPADGQLSSNTWSVTGFSDGDLLFGDESLGGDLARGTSVGGETTGGIYAATYSGDVALMVQPNEDDFTPGSLIIRIKNGTGAAINQLDIGYLVYTLNDEDRSNSINFSYSNDDIFYTDVPSLDYTSPEAADGSTFFEFKNASLTGITIPSGDAFYLRWTGNDVSGSGSRDEFALDLINITAVDPGDLPFVSFNTVALTVNESDLTADFAMQMTSSSDCTADISVSSSSTASDGTDYAFSLVSPVEFFDGGDLIQALSMDLLDDTEDEDNETLIIQIDGVSGTCVMGSPSSITITIIDDDITPILDVPIIDVHGEDGDGVCTSIGDIVRITGVVYGINLADAGLEFTVIDETGGISVFNADNDLDYTVTEGDKLTVTGTIAQINGLTEIIADSIDLLSSGNALKTPDVVSVLNEGTESDLITINGLSYIDVSQWLGDGSSFNVEMTDGINSYTMRIDNNTELSVIPAPHGDIPYTYNITGIGSQVDPDSPYSDGYEFLPRYLADFDLNQGDLIEESEKISMLIYPNPATSNLIIQSGENIESVQIIDQLGRIIKFVSVSAQEKMIDISELPVGFYGLRIKTDSGYSSSGFLKQ